MKCPLCDCETEDLVKHFDASHHGCSIGKPIDGLSFVCEACGIKMTPLSALIEHWHSDEHLYRTGKIQQRIKRLTDEVKTLNEKLAAQTRKTIKAEQEKIEILQSGYARR